MLHLRVLSLDQCALSQLALLLFLTKLIFSTLDSLLNLSILSQLVLAYFVCRLYSLAEICRVFVDFLYFFIVGQNLYDG